MSVSAHVGVPGLAPWPSSLPEPQPSSEADVRTGPELRLVAGLRTELADSPDLETGKAVIDRWVHELLAAGALDEGTTDVFERLIDDWAHRLRQRLLMESLDRQADAEALQAQARAGASRALLERKRAEREHAHALAELESARRRAAEVPVAPPTQPDASLEQPELAAASTQPLPDVLEWPNDGDA